MHKTAPRRYRRTGETLFPSGMLKTCTTEYTGDRRKNENQQCRCLQKNKIDKFRYISRANEAGNMVALCNKDARLALPYPAMLSENCSEIRFIKEKKNS